jgi:hypothetical protein
MSGDSCLEDNDMDGVYDIVEESDIVYKPRLMDELTLRDLFAAFALIGRETTSASHRIETGIRAYAMADEMMKARG